MAHMISDDRYMDFIQEFFNQKLKQFQDAGGWNVVNEKAQHCTYSRYLETGTEDCRNTARLIESLMVLLRSVKHEMKAEVERLETKVIERTGFKKMVQIIESTTKKIEDISENFTKNASLDSKPAERVDEVISFPFVPVINLEEPASGLQLTSTTSKSNEHRAFRHAQEEPTKTLVEKLHRPPASLTGSFTVDQDNETVKFLEPMRVLTFQDTTVDDTRNKDNPDHSSKKLSIGPVHIPEPPVMESELAKQWIREVAKKMSSE